MIKAYFYSLLGLFLLHSCTPPNTTADLIILNGKVATVDSTFSIKEAVAVKDKKIVFVGSQQEVQAFKGETTQLIDATNMLVLPGLIDAHGHLVSLGNQLSQLYTSECKNYEAIVEKVRMAAKNAKSREWIIGGRWDHNTWENKTFPWHDALSEAAPNNPVYLSRVDGNSALVNQKAMDIAGITATTENPEGGTIIRKPDGSPSGVLINRAMNLVKQHFPEMNIEKQKKRIQQAIYAANKDGLTGVHEAGISPFQVAAFKELVRDSLLDMRVYAMLGDQKNPEFESEDLVEYFKSIRIEEMGGHLFSLKSIKLYFDGALGSRGAAFFDPYDDDPHNRGLVRIPPDYIMEVAQAALQADMQVCTHAIGIRGNRWCLDAYEEALDKFPKDDHRFRIEHAQVVEAEDIQRFKELNILPSVQPTHCTSDKHFVVDRIGEKRAEGAYAWRSFIDAGLIMPCGSDFPVESTNPLLGIYALVTRQDVQGKPENGWFPEQKITVEEAIKGFTIWAAYGAFQEDILGSIEVGKYADFTILDQDLLTIDPKEILHTNVAYTIVGGDIKYQLQE